MATTTTNLGLTKPATSEIYNVAVVNTNADLIDAEVGKVRSTFAALSTGGVVSGGVVTAQGTPDQTVAVTECVLITPEGKRYVVAANATLAADAADATNPRIDIVYDTSAGVLTYLAGTAAATPAQPATPANGTLIAVITRAANDNTIAAADIADKRRTLQPIAYNIVNVKNYGALGNANYFNSTDKLWYVDDGYGTLAADDTAAIQAALDTVVDDVRHILIPDGNYQVNPFTKLRIRSNTKIEFSMGATLVAKTSNEDISSMLDVVTVSNVEIINPTIIGDRDHNTAVTEGAGYGISCRQVANLIIHGANISDCFTDGIYVNDVTNCLIEFCSCDGNRRQGMSVISSKNFLCRNSEFINTSGTAPQMGIDIEANTANEILENVRFENIYTASNTGGGIGINYNGMNNANTVLDVVIDQWKDDGSMNALSVVKYSGVVADSSVIRITDMKSINAVNCAVSIMQIATGSAKIILERPDIYNCRTGGGTNERSQNVAISIHDEITGFPDSTSLGNVEIIEPFIDAGPTTVLLRGIYIGYGQTLKNVIIRDPRKININDMTILSANSNHCLIGCSGTPEYETVIITDIYGILKCPHSSTLVRGYNQCLYTIYETSAASTTVTLNEFQLWGIAEDFKVIKTGSTQTLNINLPATITFLDETNTVVSGVASSATDGAIISFKRLTSTVYRLIKEFGTWTVA
jgi:hypothetical protein